MLRPRYEIKDYAKKAVALQRKSAILASFLVYLPLAVVLVLAQRIFSPNLIYSIRELYGNFTGVLSPFIHRPIGPNIYFVGLSGLFSIFETGVLHFLVSILGINLCGFYVKIFYGKPVEFSEPYSNLGVNYGRKLGGYFWMLLWLMIWSLVATPVVLFSSLFIIFGLVFAVSVSVAQATFIAIMFTILSIIVMSIPVFVKYLEYFMTPYILSSHPNVTATYALTLSKRMTKGYRGKIFTMLLSFAGWQLLNVLTLGILGIFYVNPYFSATSAGYFVELRNIAITNGTIQAAELEGYRPMCRQQNIQYPPQNTQ